MSYSTENAFLSAVLIILIIYFVYKKLFSYPDYWEKQGVKCFNPSWKQYISSFFKPLHKHEMEQYKKYGRVYGRYDGSIPVLTVADPDILRSIMVKDAHVFQNRRDCQFGDPITDNNLSLLSGEDWKRVRNIMTPSFTAAKLRYMFEKVRCCANRIVTAFSEIEATERYADLERLFGAYTMDVIAICAFGTKISSLDTPNNPFVVRAKSFLTPGFSLRSVLPVICPSLMKLFRISMLNPESNEFFRDFILQVMKERKKIKNEVHVDFLQLLLGALENDKDHPDTGTDRSSSSEAKNPKERQKYMTQNEVTAQCVMFFLAGYETTSSLLQTVIQNLALHPDIQEKVHKEIISVLKDKESPEYEDINELKYLDAVVCEALRISSSAIRMDRRAEEDFMIQELGILIKKGQLVSLPFYCMHHDPEWFPDPDSFDPERFSPEAKSSRHPFVYLPFGVGPRSCIGTRFALMQAKLMLILVLKKFKIFLGPDAKLPLQFKEKQNMMLPENVLVKLKLRK